jgi:hypothetical protein
MWRLVGLLSFCMVCFGNCRHVSISESEVKGIPDQDSKIRVMRDAFIDAPAFENVKAAETLAGKSFHCNARSAIVNETTESTYDIALGRELFEGKTLTYIGQGAEKHFVGYREYDGVTNRVIAVSKTYMAKSPPEIRCDRIFMRAMKLDEKGRLLIEESYKLNEPGCKWTVPATDGSIYDNATSYAICDSIAAN